MIAFFWGNKLNSEEKENSQRFMISIMNCLDKRKNVDVEIIVLGENLILTYANRDQVIEHIEKN